MSLPAIPDLSRKNKFLLATVLIISILIPLLFWRSVWFGRTLTPDQILQQLVAPANLRETQHALAWVDQMIRAGDSGVSRFYPAIAGLSDHEKPEIRNLAAWVMGQDSRSTLFHETLLRMVKDPDPLVRRNAALGLVRFEDRTALSELRSMLKPFTVRAPSPGVIRLEVRSGEWVSPASTVAQLESDQSRWPIPAQLPSRVLTLRVEDGQTVQSGQEIATLAPPPEHVWEALRALYLMGEASDLQLVEPFIGNPAYSDELREQARLTAEKLRAGDSN